MHWEPGNEQPACVPAGHVPPSGFITHIGAAPPQHGYTQYWVGPQVCEPHANGPPPPEPALAPPAPPDPAAAPPEPACAPPVPPEPALDPPEPALDPPEPALDPPEPALDPPEPALDPPDPPPALLVPPPQAARVRMLVKAKLSARIMRARRAKRVPARMRGQFRVCVPARVPVAELAGPFMAANSPTGSESASARIGADLGPAPSRVPQKLLKLPLRVSAVKRPTVAL